MIGLYSIKRSDVHEFPCFNCSNENQELEKNRRCVRNRSGCCDWILFFHFIYCCILLFIDIYYIVDVSYRYLVTRSSVTDIYCIPLYTLTVILISFVLICP